LLDSASWYRRQGELAIHEILSHEQTALLCRPLTRLMGWIETPGARRPYPGLTARLLDWPLIGNPAPFSPTTCHNLSRRAVTGNLLGHVFNKIILKPMRKSIDDFESKHPGDFVWRRA